MEKYGCDKINIAIVGVGRIGKRHAKYANSLANLVAVCDIKKDEADSIADIYNCHSYYDIDTLLEHEKNLDLVSICTPNGLHAEHSIKALNKNNNVLCEKPMALYVHDCEQMMHAAEMHNKRLFVVKQNRFNPPVKAVKKAIEEGRLGKIFSIQVNCFWNRNKQYYTSSNWKGTSDLDGGTLFTQFSHFIDLIYWLVGDITEVAAFTGNYVHKDLFSFEDAGVVDMRLSNGGIGSLHYTVNSYGHNMEGSITLFGEKGTVKIGGEYLNVLEYQNIKDYVITNLEKSKPPNEYGHYQGSMSNHDEVYANVINVLKNNGSIRTDMIDGLKTVQIIRRIYDAANN